MLSQSPPNSRIPVSLITGFLGSGKTTLLNRLLKAPDMKDVLVLINEFGEIGLDHQLVQAVDGDMVVLENGCLCCTIQNDLSKTLHEMAVRRLERSVPLFHRVVVETTGLADPGPIIHSLMQGSIVTAQYRLDGVIATVDAVNGCSQLDRQPEAVKQAAMADRIVISKSDIADEQMISSLRARLIRLNPAAPQLNASDGEAGLESLFNVGLYNPATKSLDVRRWLNAAVYSEDHHGHDHDVNRHDTSIAATCLTLVDPVDWLSFAEWVHELADHRGEDLLRVKAILSVCGQPRPVVVHGVQRLFHPPIQLPQWPDDDHRSRIVLITRDMDPPELKTSLTTRLRLSPARGTSDAASELAL